MPRPYYPVFRVTPPGIRARLTRPAPWRPMTDDEWEQVMHFMVYVHPGPGRPTIAGARRSLDACFHAACNPGPWRALPEHFGKWKSVHRLFNRWAHAGLWNMLLKFVAKERAGLADLTYWVCRAFRRAWRILDLRGICLARRLGMDTALRAPSWWLPDPDFERFLNTLYLKREMPRAFRMNQADGLIHIRFLHWLHRGITGRTRIARWMSPP